MLMRVLGRVKSVSARHCVQNCVGRVATASPISSLWRACDPKSAPGPIAKTESGMVSSVRLEKAKPKPRIVVSVSGREIVTMGGWQLEILVLPEMLPRGIAVKEGGTTACPLRSTLKSHAPLTPLTATATTSAAHNAWVHRFG